MLEGRMAFHAISEGIMVTINRFVLITLFTCATLVFAPVTNACAQEGDASVVKQDVGPGDTQELDAIATLGNLLATRKEQQAVVAAFKKQLRAAREDATRTELKANITEAQNKLSQLDAQLTAISTGVADDSFANRQGQPFNLQSELVGLAEPFVKMMREATATAREIEKLRSTQNEAKRQTELARKALMRITQLKDALPKNERTARSAEARHLKEQDEIWQKRLQESGDLAETAAQQLQIRQDEQANSSTDVGEVVIDFLRNRGLNLLLAFGAFFGVFMLSRVIGQFFGRMRQKQKIKRSFAVRVGSLVYRVVTILISLFAMLFVLNLMNDWILLGMTSVFAVAIAWIGLKMLPAIVEQTTLLLDLGAVQEGERVMLNNVPWRVEHLDFYTDLVNPDLEGGTFTLPVRELVGLHSRPAAVDEAWFPTRKGDWAQLADGRTGEIVIQTPELVQLVELGGSRVTYATADFLANTPRNLSTGYRVEVSFGIDYKHQIDAVDEIPTKLRKHIHAGLSEMLNGKGLRGVDVDLAGTGASSIDYDIEADIAGDHAHLFEDIEREISRLLVDACNTYNWTIPYPQMVLHQAST